MARLPGVLLFLLLSTAVLAQTASFTYRTDAGSFCSPATVHFTQTASGNPTGFLWKFGNGQISTAANPSIVYNNAGTYTVELTVVYENVGVVAAQNIAVNPGVSISLTADRNYICKPGPIQFTTTALGNTGKYEWNFGDGSPATTTATATTTHNYTTLGTYTATVKAVDTTGCFDTASYELVLQDIPLTATVSRKEGCIPAAVSFDVNALVPIGTTVSSYQYSFGDGTPVTNGTTAAVSHTYSTTGSFNPSVTVNTNEGCKSVFNFAPVAFGTPPTGLYAYPDTTTYCGSETPVFVAKAVNANRYHWNFGDGDTSLVNDTVTRHQYGALGFKTVTVTPYFNGCAGASTSFQIEIIGVIASFTAANTCSAKNRFSFTNTTDGTPSSMLWNFGDNSPTVTVANPVHTYLRGGSFPVTLSVVDSITGCTDDFTGAIHTGLSQLINPDTSVCRKDSTLFSIVNDQSNDNAAYTWNVAGLSVGPQPGKTFKAYASLLGNYTRNFVVIDNGAGYCLDTADLQHPLGVRGPDLEFENVDTICQNKPFSLVNSSKPFNPKDSIVSWRWSFDFPTVNDSISIYQPQPVTFPGPGLYGVRLVARDWTGCTDTLSKPVKVDPAPFVQIVPGKDTLCQGRPDTLIAFHTDSLLWSPANLVSCSSCDTVSINPPASTIIVATAKNMYGCTMSDTGFVKVYPKITARAVASPLLICKGESVRIDVSPPGNFVTWSPAAGLSSATGYNPLASPSQTTAYIATMKDSAGCFTSEATVNVIVKSLPEVDAGPDRILPYNAPFTIEPVYSSNVRKYLWTPAGTLTCTNCPRPNGNALEGENYIIEVTSDSGCVSRDSVKIGVECKYTNLLVPSAFTPNNDFQNDRFYPIARGIKTIKRFVIFNRFGQALFEARDFKPNNASLGWDGRFKGQDQTFGTYVYLLEAVCDAGGIITKKDSFLLLR